MLSKVLALMTGKFSWALYVAGAIVCFGSGWYVTSNYYEAKIHEAYREYAESSAAQEAAYREKERQAAAAMVAAWEERDRALASLVSVRSDADRVRIEADDLKRRLSADAGGPCDAERKRIAEGAELVARGADLAERCVRMAQRLSADKDAVVTATVPR